MQVLHLHSGFYYAIFLVVIPTKYWSVQMYYETRVEIPESKGKITYKTIKGTTYVNYEYDRTYIPEKQYTKVKRTTIGKRCSDDENFMFPNINFVKYFPDVEYSDSRSAKVRSCCLKAGSYIAISKVVSHYHLDEMLGRIIGKDSGLFLDLAAYSIVCENNAAQYYPDYAFNHPLFTEEMRIYSDAKVSDFLTNMVKDKSISFLNEWNTSRDHRERIYISYDSTNKSCQSGEIDLAEPGHSKDGLDLPVVNYSVAFDKTNREPLFYEQYPGSIVDVSQLQMMLEKARGFGYKRVGFILDRGYFSKENIRFMDKNGYEFVIMVKGMRALVNNLVEEHRGSFETARACHISRYGVNGKTVRGRLYPSDEKDRYFHIYYNMEKAASERSEFEGRIDRISALLKSLQGKAKHLDPAFERHFELIYHNPGQEDQLFVLAREKEDVVERAIRLCGYFCIITSEKMTADEALNLYKGRDSSEKLFRGDKSYLGNRSLRVHSEAAAENKIFIEFVALIIRNRIYNCLKDASEDRKANYMTVPAAIRELDKLEMVRLVDNVYRPDHALTSTQKTIFKALGIDSIFVKEQMKKITQQLKGGDDGKR